MNITVFTHNLFYTLLDFCTSRQSLGLDYWGLHCRDRDEHEQRKGSRCTDAETRPFPDFHQVGMSMTSFLCNFMHLVCVHWSSFLELSFRKPISDQAAIIHTTIAVLSLSLSLSHTHTHTHTLEITYGPLCPSSPLAQPDLCCTQNPQVLHFNEWQPKKMCAKD